MGLFASLPGQPLNMPRNRSGKQGILLYSFAQMSDPRTFLLVTHMGIITDDAHMSDEFLAWERGLYPDRSA